MIIRFQAQFEWARAQPRGPPPSILELAKKTTCCREEFESALKSAPASQITERDDEGRTPLHLVVKYANQANLELLLKYGVRAKLDVNARTHRGADALGL